MSIEGTPNRDLATGHDNKAHWNTPDVRRHGFHNLHTTARYALSLRAPSVRALRKEIDWTIGRRPGVENILEVGHFCALVVLRDERVLFEAYASDFGPDRPHSIQSITKMTLNLMLGQVVAAGLVDLNAPIQTYLPEIGSGYATASVRDTADMNIANDFSEDYADPHTGSYVMETAMGWRLPEEGIPEPTIRSFLQGITSADLTNRTGHALYKSTNSDVIGWIIERVSGKSLRHWLIEIVEAAGMAGCFHITCDRDGVPLVDGGACLSARDLARLGLLFAHYGEGVGGRKVGDADFIEDTRRNTGPAMPKPRDWIKYTRQTMTDGVWIGHGGYGGQFMLANPDTKTAVAYFSVLENKDAYDPEFYAPLIKTMGEIAAAV